MLSRLAAPLRKLGAKLEPIEGSFSKKRDGREHSSGEPSDDEGGGGGGGRGRGGGGRRGGDELGVLPCAARALFERVTSAAHRGEGEGDDDGRAHSEVR